MSKPGPIVTTDKGNPITRNPARVVFAADALRTMTYTEARAAIVARWGIHPVTAEKDLKAARKLIALELDGMGTRAAEVVRNERIADKAETLADKAAERAKAVGSTAADWSAVAALQRTAVAASREVARLTGAYAPKQIKVTHGLATEIPCRIDKLLAVLSPAGLAHMDAVHEEMLQLIASGVLVPGDDPDEADDAEFTDVPDVKPDARPDEN